MRSTRKIPAVSVLLLLVGYTTFGWLLSIYHSDWRIWISSGAVAFATAWSLALAWAIAAVILVFAAKPQTLGLAVGICLVWALMMFVARTEVKAASGNPWQSWLVLLLIAAIGMGVGWFVDISLIPSLGKSIMKVSL